MQRRLPFVFFFLGLTILVSCKRKVSGGYEFFQPYKRDTVKVIEVKPDSVTVKQTGELPIEKKETRIAKPVDLTEKYFIVIASYTIHDYALAAKETLKQEGYSPEVFMLNNDGWYRLAVESFKTIQEADRALNSIRLQGGIFSDARIVIR